MILTDGTHLVSDKSLKELHIFANYADIKHRYFHGVRKKHPHYDLPNVRILDRALNTGAVVVRSRELVKRMARA